MGVVSEMSVTNFLRLPFATVSDGGFAGLVFLVSQSADAPELHRDFFAQWTDIHDVTRRFLAVITPSPGVITLDEQPIIALTFEVVALALLAASAVVTLIVLF